MDMTHDAATGGGERTPVVVHTAAGDGNLSLRDAASAVRTWRRKGSPPERASATASASAAGAPDTRHRDAPGTAPFDRDGRGGNPDAISLRDLRERTPDDLKRDTRPRPVAQEAWQETGQEMQQATWRDPRQDPRQAARSEPRADTRYDPRSDPAMQPAAIAQEEALRQQAERALPVIMHTLERTLAGEFPDIRSQADMVRLAQTQPQRFARLQTLNGRLAEAQHEAAVLQEHHGRRQVLESYKAREGERLKAHIPEVDDEAQWSRLRSSAVATLKTLDYSDAELAHLWRGTAALSIHDHRFQRLLRDAVRWQELQSGAAAVLPESAHAPRTVHVRSEDARARLRDLGNELERSRGVNAVQAAADLLAERRWATRFR